MVWTGQEVAHLGIGVEGQQAAAGYGKCVEKVFHAISRLCVGVVSIIGVQGG